MELLKGTAPTVEFVHPTSDTTSVSAVYSLDGGGDVNTTTTTADGISSFRLPYIKDAASIRVTWTFTIPGNDPYTESFNYDVATPYLTIAEVKKIYPDATDAEAIEVEAAVRHVINAHTGQSFGKTRKTLLVEGHGESALRLPERLIEVTAIETTSARLEPKASIIVSDGWYLKKGWSSEVEAIESDSYYWDGWGSSPGIPNTPGYVKPGHGPVVVMPGSGAKPTIWKDDYPFKITGLWGYEEIPAPVKEAAKLLVNDYACSEINYRDRYLDSIRAADWRLEFNSQAWDRTGNVRADQLLSDYVLFSWAVI